MCCVCSLQCAVCSVYYSPDTHLAAPVHHVLELRLITTATGQFVADRLVTLPPWSLRVLSDHGVLVGGGRLGEGGGG